MRVNKIMPDYGINKKNKTCAQRPTVSFGQNQPKANSGIISSVLKWLWDGWVQASEILAQGYRMY